MTTTLPAAPRPRPHQLAAIDAAEKAYLGGALRVQWRAACGVGKTLAAVWLAQRMQARTVVVFEPSIALVSQTISAWRASGIPMRMLAVCSDPSTASSRAEIGVDGINAWDSREFADMATTRADVAARFLDGADQVGPVMTVIVATYHSAQVMAEALQLTDRCSVVSLLVADEAHHLAGRPSQTFMPVLDDRRIPAQRRLFQTATPVVIARRGGYWDAASGAGGQARCMDDEELFGPTVYTMGVRAAIAENLLTDYRVVVTAATSSEVAVGDLAAVAALAEVAQRYGVRRVLTFHNRVAAARAFTERVNDLGVLGGVPARAASVDGTMSAQERRRALSLLDDDDHGGLTVIASAQCLREGIDVPGVDAVLFADPRTSAVGIAQAIGRALRRHPSKTLGHIVIPVVLDDAGDDSEQLADSGYSHLWRVLQGLAAHDEQVAFDLDRAREAPRRGSHEEIPAWLEVFDHAAGSVMSRLLRRNSPVWESHYRRLCAAAEKFGSAAQITSKTDADLCGWIQEQRTRYRRGDLDSERVHRLEQVPGWWWDRHDAADERSLRVLDGVVAQRGSLREPCSGDSIYHSIKDGAGRSMQVWVATQVCRYRSGDLPVWLGEELAARPGWTWTPLSGPDDAGFEAFRSFIGWEGHADIPADAVEGDVALGQWISEVRCRRVLGALPPALEGLLIAAAPRTRAGGSTFRWHRSPSWWSINMEATRRYINGGGRLEQMPDKHTEMIEGTPVAISQWLSKIRHLHNSKQALTAEQIADVEALEGFRWHVAAVAERVPVGSPRACTTAGCDRRRSRRQLCSTHYELQRSSEQDGGLWVSAYVSAAPVRQHVEALKAAGLGRRRIAARAGVNDKTIIVLLAGRAERQTGPSTKMLATTAAKLLAVPVPEKSEAVIVDAAHARRQLEELIAGAGCSRAAMYRTCGISTATGTSLLTGKSARISIVTAERIAAQWAQAQLSVAA